MSTQAIVDIEVASEVADRFQIARSTLSEWCARRKFPHVKYPGSKVIRFPRAWTDAYLAGNCELVVTELAAGGRVVKPKGIKP